MWSLNRSAVNMQALIEACGVNVKDVEGIWKKEYEFSALSAFIQGPLGADRIDFVLRDSYYAGTRHLGTIAYDRIITFSSIVDKALVYDYKIMQDIYQALFARYFMYDTVYLHPKYYYCLFTYY